jgi:hypothetical protein
MPTTAARRALAVFAGAHGIAHFAGTSDVFDRAARGEPVSWLAGGWEVSEPALMRAFGVAWALVAAAYVVVAVAVWRGQARWPRALAGVTVASLLLVAIALWSSVIGLVLDVVLLAVAVWAARHHPQTEKGAFRVHPA